MPDASGRVRRRYGGRDLVGDLTGGTIAALIALPYGLAMARLMGLPPALGLFTSILTGPVTALVGRNPVLIGGTASATVPFLAAAVKLDGVGGAAKVTLLASAFMMAFGVLRLGRYAAQIPHAVVSGFSCGVGAMMVLVQARPLLGLPDAPGPARGGTLGGLVRALAHVGEARGPALALAAVTIVGAWLVHRRWPKAPAPLFGVAMAMALAGATGWAEAVVGEVGPTVALASFRWKATDLDWVIPEAFGLAFVASINVLMTSRVVEHFRGRHRPLRPADADRELGAYGIANLVAGAFGAPPSVGIPARSLANVRCGGTTRLSNLFHAAILFGLVRYGSALIGRIPLTALAAVTAFVGVGLLEWSTWRRLPRMRRADAAAFLATALAVLLADAITAVAVGSAIALAPGLFRRLAPARPLPRSAVAGLGNESPG